MAKPGQPHFSVDEVNKRHVADKTFLYIKGRRTGRPNKRFILKTTRLKISSAQIENRQKNKVIEHTVNRINYLPTFNQTRIHTAGLIYPGEYHIVLEVGADSEQLPEPISQLFD